MEKRNGEKLNFHFRSGIKNHTTMGRYYSGDICGKFCVAVQCSYDADNFCIPEQTRRDLFSFKECGCLNIQNDKFCDNCYDSYEEHSQDVGESEVIQEEVSEIEYHFTQNELEIVKDKLQEIGEELGSEVLQNLTISFKRDDGFEYSYEIDDDILYDEELLIRYCFGKQIEACLIENGHCSFGCEI